MNDATDNGLAERMAYHGPRKLKGYTALEAAFEDLGVEGLPASEAIQEVRDRADELPAIIRRDLTDQGLLAKPAA